ncbi:MAG: type II toxin-antitoxin system CcdA family antitoxin [Candidatus Brockarchaeota archaeon]|nr:type II toxin-antitoxin system CcdA family antitoxin [Candidatus Brockarchaeota archaeon]MBO3808994.1 type II toxin-antitoxin system CcdA family antitoxin [Candidatus Brockarchaeota archaeon]MBO3832313.1 type II toxin-antitoxin system CcdA family antitoxin [Candidatus Brockarchaeota archaeon]
MSATITVRVPRQLKEEAKRHGIKLSQVVRRALEKEVRRKRIEEARRAAGELGELFSKVSEKEIVRSIREARRAG